MRHAYKRMGPMKMRAVLALLLLAAVVPSDAAAKGVAVLVVVGADGRSSKIEAEHAVLSVMLYHPASVYHVRPKPAMPRGGYVKIYPLGAGGIPAIPGRFYPTTRALCFSWNQRVAPSSCGRLGPPSHLLAASRGLTRFHGQSTVLTALRPGGTVNLFAALQLAFDRYRASRPANRPQRCLPFVARWAGPRTAQRPSRICVFPHGVYARGRIYPTGRAIWRLALDAS
jgi:hypothetical protein